MTSAAFVAMRVATDEKATAEAAKPKHQSDVVAGDAININARSRRPLRRLREGDAFILDINAGDRQCMMHARASR